MLNSLKEHSGWVALVVIAILFVTGGFWTETNTTINTTNNIPADAPDMQQGLGGSQSCAGVTCLEGGLRLMSTLGGLFESDVSVRASSTLQATGAATFYGGITNVTSNSATSTTAVGCIQTTATSTESPIQLIMGNTNTTATSTFDGTVTNGGGFVIWRFGTCP